MTRTERLTASLVTFGVTALAMLTCVMSAGIFGWR